MAQAKTGDTVRIHYTGKLDDGSEDANLALNLEVMGDLLELLEGILELKARARVDA